MSGRAIHAISDDSPHVLVVDDDRRLRDLLARFLGENGYRVTAAKDSADARKILGLLRFDSLILDVMMPGENGFELARAIRKGSDVPILMLTARTEADDRVTGLEIGADDYLAKPFEPRELLLRLKNVQRRTATAVQDERNEVSFGRFVFRRDRGLLQSGDEVVRLTDREREILAVLSAKPGETVPREALAAKGEISNERTVDVQINRLRRKIEDDPANPLHLQTVRGVGYRLIGT
jgi:two-component system phosphate regulon response regulator OmpR